MVWIFSNSTFFTTMLPILPSILRQRYQIEAQTTIIQQQSPSSLPQSISTLINTTRLPTPDSLSQRLLAVMRRQFANIASNKASATKQGGFSANVILLHFLSRDFPSHSPASRISSNVHFVFLIINLKDSDAVPHPSGCRPQRSRG